MTRITVKDMTDDPGAFAEEMVLGSGERLTFRPLAREDATLLNGYFGMLSAETRRRYAPHAFTLEQAEKLCREIDYRHTIRLLATDSAERKPSYDHYGSSTADEDLEGCDSLWYGPRIQIVQPGSGQHVKESSTFPLWHGDEDKEFDKGLRFNSPAGRQALHLRMREIRLETGMEAPSKRLRAE